MRREDAFKLKGLNRKAAQRLWFEQLVLLIAPEAALPSSVSV